MKLRSIDGNNQIYIETGSGAGYPIGTIHDWPDDFLNEAKRAHSKILLISQKGLEQAVVEPFLQRYPDIHRDDVFLIEQGEHNKHIDNLAPVYNHLIRRGVDRHSLILALGGGVVGDFAGFVAATLLRGVPYVQLPTTLLAAVDSSVGGKTAVNVDLGKNMVGAFYHPVAVLFNLSTLQTLPDREWVCGLAEMAKHAFMDPGHLEELDMWAEKLKDPGTDELKKAIHLSVRFKAGVVSKDEKEKGLRAILNLGHTTGHAIESLTEYRRYNHGEAVSRGLVTAVFLSQAITGLEEKDALRMLSLMEKLGLPMDTDGLDGNGLLEHMKYDKKNRDGEVRFVLLRKQGEPVFDIPVESAVFLSAWDKQKRRYG